MNCIVVDDDAMARMLIEHYISQNEDLKLVASCESAIEAANVLKKHSVDLMFLDVEMPEMTGIEFIESLVQHPQVILITSKEQYALDAFDMEVTDYLLKPVKYARFLKAIQRAQKRNPVAEAPTPTEDQHVFIKTEGRLVNLELSDIQWIEAQGDYVKVQTPKESYIVHGTIKSYEEKLPDASFVRVHRSYIVRIDQIVDIADASIVIGRSVIPIGASFKETLLKRLKML
jgi:DNA-binding LytR/AlgR family response regulator